MARGFLMAMVAVNDVGRDELVQEARNGLDADEASNKTCHHDEPRGLVGPAILLKILFRLGEHAVEGREKLRGKTSATFICNQAKELTMTPKLRLREQARKTLLSCMRNDRLPGKSRTMASTQMMEAPKTQAGAAHKVNKSAPGQALARG